MTLFPTHEEIANMSFKARALRAFVVFLVFAVIGTLIAVFGKAVTEPKVITPQIQNVSCVEANGRPCTYYYNRSARYFKARRLGRARTGFHASKWMAHPVRERERVVSYIVHHPNRVPRTMRGSKAARSAWVRSLDKASCVWPGEYTRYLKNTWGKPPCTGLHATPGKPFQQQKRWLNKNWKVVGFTVCEGILAITMRRSGSSDLVSFGAGTGGCAFSTFDQRMQNRLMASR